MSVAIRDIPFLSRRAFYTFKMLWASAVLRGHKNIHWDRVLLTIADAKEIVDHYCEKYNIFVSAKNDMENNLFKLLVAVDDHCIIDVEIDGIKVPALAYSQDENTKPVIIAVLVTNGEFFKKLKILGIRV